MNEDCSEFVEIDPTGRYGRYKEVLGKGASKIVYRAFDEYQGIEVAWNQVKLHDFLQSPDDLERLYCEIHLLKTLQHNNIMKYYTSWIDTAKRNINFVTEMFTSGTLKQYREKHKRVNIRAVKSWCRQILEGLLYLHNLDPPVIHRDLKCDNIFVNGNQGEVKIGDLGLAAILRKSHVAHCVGTPEFMAPEVYEEEYNELVDIYSFGMCILEMVTFEYPYSECTHSAQIYKKVISVGKRPDALNKVKDPEVRQFIDKCLAAVPLRLSARELLDDPFLKTDCKFDLESMASWKEGGYELFLPREPCIELDHEGNSNGNRTLDDYLNGVNFGSKSGEYDSKKIEQCGIELFDYSDEREEHLTNVGIAMKGKRKEDGSIFLRLRISDDEERIRNIYFPFDVENDTALSVATEMVAELDITDQDVTKIADMIDREIMSLVPEWKPGPGIVETPRFSKSVCCQNCASNHSSTGSFLNFLSNTSVSQELKILQCSGNGCAAMHGRFEEITYQIDSPRKNASKIVNNPSMSNQVNNNSSRTEISDRHESLECSTHRSGKSCSDEEIEKVDRIISSEGKIKQKVLERNNLFRRKFIKSFADLSIKAVSCFSNDVSEGYEGKVQQEMRWVKARYQREITDQQLRLVQNSPIKKRVINGVSPFSLSNPFQGEIISKSFSNSRKNGLKPPRNSGPVPRSYEENMIFNTLHRSSSLPVDAMLPFGFHN